MFSLLQISLKLRPGGILILFPQHVYFSCILLVPGRRSCYRISMELKAWTLTGSQQNGCYSFEAILFLTNYITGHNSKCSLTYSHLFTFSVTVYILPFFALFQLKQTLSIFMFDKGWIIFYDTFEQKF